LLGELSEKFTNPVDTAGYYLVNSNTLLLDHGTETKCQINCPDPLLHLMSR